MSSLAFVIAFLFIVVILGIIFGGKNPTQVETNKANMLLIRRHYSSDYWGYMSFTQSTHYLGIVAILLAILGPLLKKPDKFEIFFWILKDPFSPFGLLGPRWIYRGLDLEGQRPCESGESHTYCLADWLNLTEGSC